MSKIPRDSAAFASRVMMSSRTQLFVLVEGRELDRPFYERVLRSNPNARLHGFSVRLVEDIELDGRSAGGKPFALALYKRFLDRQQLSQSNGLRENRIVFMMDRDYSDYDKNKFGESHIILTQGADVECEILRNGKIRKSAQAHYGLTRTHAASALPRNVEALSRLAQHWERWITLRAVSVAIASQQSTRYGGVSQVHQDGFGDFDALKARSLKASLVTEALTAGKEADVLAAEYNVRLRLSSEGEHTLIKGRWLAKYIEYLIRQKLSAETVSRGAKPDGLAAVCLGTLSFRNNWASYYHTQIDAMLA
jgi:hypothetical protein